MENYPLPGIPGRLIAPYFLKSGRKLYFDNRRPLTLTNWARLKLSMAITSTGKGVDVGKLVDFSETPMERKLIELISQVKPHLFHSYTDPLKALCILRTVHIPHICREFINLAAKKDQSKLEYMGPIATHARACAKAICELKILSRAKFDIKGSPKAKDKGKKWRQRFERPIDEWFDDSPQIYLLWIYRFDQWRRAALRAWTYWMEKQSIDARRETGILQEAALLGLLKHRNSLPEKSLSCWLRQIEADPKAQRLFRKNARNSRYPTKTGFIDLNTWLIEIWPVVLEYGWNWVDLQRVIASRFEFNKEVGFIDRVKELKRHCGTLDLKLGTAGQTKCGRPRHLSNEQENSAEEQFPFMSQIPRHTAGIGSNPSNWVLSQVDIGS